MHNIKNKVPIIFIHKGYSNYLEYTLRQTKYFNEDSEVILLTDFTKHNYPDKIKIHNISKYERRAISFAKKYKHLSTNSYNFELFCFQRWFILLDFLFAHKLKMFFACDSDVLLYTNMSKCITENFNNSDIALVEILKKKSAGISFWQKKSLEEFCKYLETIYTNPSHLNKYEKYYDNLKAKCTRRSLRYDSSYIFWQ